MRLSRFLPTFRVPVSAAAVAEPPTNNVEQNKALVRRLFEAIRTGDLATSNELNDPKAIVHTPSGTTHEAGGPHSDLKSALPMCVAVNPREVSIELMIAEGDLVVVRSTLRGKHSGELGGVPPTGRDITMTYVNIYRIRDGRIVENWASSDRLSLMKQLGMTLCPEGTGK